MEAVVNFALDGVTKSCDVGEGGMVAIDESEGVAGGDSGAAHNEAFVKASLIEEPCSGEFDLTGTCRPVWNFFYWSCECIG